MHSYTFIKTALIIKDVTNNIATSKQDNTNFEDYAQEDEIILKTIQEENNDNFESNCSNGSESPSCIITQGILSLELLTSFGRWIVIIVAIRVLGLLTYLLYKKWKQVRDEYVEYDKDGLLNLQGYI